jgi:outer membrane protein TolC
VEIEQERLAVLEQIRKVVLKRYQNGLGNLDEMSTATSRTEIAKADVSEQQTFFLREKRKMQLLLGRYQGGIMTVPDKLPKVASPPVQIPATVLLNRPDIQAALAKVESARLLADSAEKARLPGLNLSGQLFREAASLNNIGKATGYWSVLGSLLQPVFDGGGLQAVAQAGHTEFQASLMDLQATVLQALQEVEDGFELERDYAAQVQFLKNGVKKSEQSSRYYTRRYKQGLDTIQNLLIAREQEMSVKSRLNQTITGRLSNRVDLALALGVGLTDNRVAGDIQ